MSQVIDQYIQKLLTETDSVHVPNLGTFTTTRESAQMNAEGKTIAPPNKKIIFSESSEGDDTALQKAVTEGEKISVEEYEGLLQAFQDAIKAQLVSFGKYKMADLGVLTKDSTGKLQFEQNSTTTILNESFGLPSVKAEPIAPKKETPKVTKKVEKKPQKATSQGFSPWLMVVIPLVFTLIFLLYLSTRKDTLTSLKSIFRTPPKVEEVTYTDNNPITENSESTSSGDENTASGWIEDTEANTDENTEEKTEDFADVTENAEDFAETTEDVVDNATGWESSDNESDNNTQAADETTGSVQVSEVVSGKYYIVAGSFSSIKSTKPLLKKMADVSNVKVVPYASKNMYRVVIGAFDDEPSALEEMRRLAEKYGEMWIAKM